MIEAVLNISAKPASSKPTNMPAPPTNDAQMTNVAPAEAAYFKRLANQWWNTSGPLWPLHRLNHLRANFLKARLGAHFALSENVHQPLAGLHILDVGCGGGLLSEAMARLGAHVHGIDVVEKSIAVATEHARDTGLEVSYECTTARAHSKQTRNRYDVVLNMEVVEHVPDVGSLIKDCGVLLQASGVMVVATLNRTLKSWLFAVVGAEYIMRWLPRGTHGWQQFVTPDELEGHLRSCGMSPLESCGVRVNPITRKFSLTSSLSVNYMMLATPKSQATVPGSIDVRSL